MKSVTQFLWVCGTMIMFLAAIELLKGHSVAEALPFAASWGFLSAAIFAGSRYYQARKGVRCALCDDLSQER
jgi:hypothetical protein